MSEEKGFEVFILYFDWTIWSNIEFQTELIVEQYLSVILKMNKERNP